MSITALRPLLPDAPVDDLADHLAQGGGRGLARARALGPGGTLTEVGLSRLRGRGGGGFPTGRKWRTIAGSAGPRYVVTNAAEGEPGTFKDRTLLRLDPYSVLEGLAIAAHTVDAQEAVVATKGSFHRELDRVVAALEEVTAAGWFGDRAVRVVGGPEEYLFGEETALLEVVEGRDPLPRVLPPYLHGLFVTDVQLGWTAGSPPEGGATAGAHPTLVNNAETLALAARVLADGPEAFRSVGTDRSPGPLLVTVTGDVAVEGVVEVAMGSTLREAVAALAGDVPDDVRCVLSGVANAPLGAEALDLPMTYEAFAEAGGGLGSAGFTLYGEGTCTLAVARAVSGFLAVESCGQCPPCKQGSTAITAVLDGLLDGSAGEDVLDDLHAHLRRVTDGNRCYLAVEEQQAVSGFLRRFPDDVVAHLEHRCGRDHDVVVPKIVDVVGGRAVLDHRRPGRHPVVAATDVPVATPGR